MSEGSSPAPDTPQPGADPNRSHRLHRTTYIWLALLIAVSLLPALLSARGGTKPARQQEGLTADVFSRLVSAEAQTRLAFGLLSSLRKYAPELKEQRNKTLEKAVDDYRSLLGDVPGPGIARRVIILDAVLDRPLDRSLLHKRLASSLREMRVPPARIAEEIALWESLYGAGKPTGRSLESNERLIRSFRMPFLTNQALHDLYAAAVRKREAARFADDLRAEAGLIQGLLSMSVLAFLAGVLFLGLYVSNAFARRWDRLARLATQPARTGWSDLLDAFVFYLLAARGTSLIVGLAARPFVTTLSPKLEMILQAAVYVGSALIALLYLRWRIRQRGATLIDLGLVGRNRLVGHIAYGVAGYLATIPLIMAARLLSDAIFQRLPETSPNPIMPLILAERDPAGRLLIFFLVAIAAPFAEELFFRGVLYTGLRSRWTWPAAVAASSLVFAMLHPPQDWLPIFTLGVGFGVMRELRQSLIPSITAHFIQNASTFVLLSMLFRSS